eukprot:gene5317-7088_t
MESTSDLAVGPTNDFGSNVLQKSTDIVDHLVDSDDKSHSISKSCFNERNDEETYLSHVHDTYNHEQPSGDWWKGACQFCFTERLSWFQGRAFPGCISEKRTVTVKNQLGLLAERLSPEEQEHELGKATDPCFHQCCFSDEDPPTFYRITITDFSSTSRQAFPLVVRTNGDYVKLMSPDFSFKTDDIIIGQEACTYARVFFPKMTTDDKAKEDVLVCFGTVRIRCNSPSQHNSSVESMEMPAESQYHQSETRTTAKNKPTKGHTQSNGSSSHSQQKRPKTFDMFGIDDGKYI